MWRPDVFLNCCQLAAPQRQGLNNFIYLQNMIKPVMMEFLHEDRLRKGTKK